MFKNNSCLISIILVSFFIISGFSVIEVKSNYLLDFDPFADVQVTVEINQIRSFDKDDPQINFREYIDSNSDPDFYVKILINNQEFTSNIWYDKKYIYEPQFSAIMDVPDDEEFVTVIIQLWDWNDNGDILCDIGDENDFAELSYSIKTGHWTGDDQIEDSSGYGRLNGCDDGSIYLRDLDCEILFDIYQNDIDGDRVPYWIELNEYGTNPEIDNSDDDNDGDNIPLIWEWKWGYDPLKKDNHKDIDPEVDGIDNYEEYLTSQWGSDPYRKDVFVELDQMEAGPNAEPSSILPDGSNELITTAFNRQNVVFHLDDGIMGGSDIIPFDEQTPYNELRDLYWDYFLHGDENYWKAGVFHYGLVVYDAGFTGYNWKNDGFQISSSLIEHNNFRNILFSLNILDLEVAYASVYMHELGHQFAFNPIPGHNRGSYYPWQIGWWINRPYISCMNYGYMYTTVDYSDGSQSDGDYDDWERMDLTAFQRDWGQITNH